MYQVAVENKVDPITGASPEEDLRKISWKYFFFFYACWNGFQKKNRSAGWDTVGNFISNGGHCAVTVEDLASQVRSGHRWENTEKGEGWSPMAQKYCSSLLHPGHWDFQFEKGGGLLREGRPVVTGR